MMHFVYNKEHMKRYIELNTWKRKDHFSFFSQYEIPRFNMTFDLDVTKLYQWAKNENVSFYLALMHHVIQSLNQVENFQYRIDEKGVFLEPIRYVSFTDKRASDDLFKMVFCEVDDDCLTFINHAKKTSEKQGDIFFVPASEAVLNTIYVTSFPWRRFHHFSHATLLGPKDSVPRISWSQFETIEDRKILTLSVEVHHGLVDGVHVAQWLTLLENRFNNL
jgi:chloramphenicol O-acetyltransferase type A